MSQVVSSSPAPIVLDVQDVTFRRDAVQILDGVSFTVCAGEHWAMLGPNGAGKSTVLSMCGAQQHPTSGTVDVLGKRLGRVELQALRREIGHVNPRHPLRSAANVVDVVLTGFTGTVERPMRWEPTPEQQRRADELVEAVGLGRHRDAVWPTMSQGERGRALVARALAGSPRLLLFDEPTTGLDVAAREQLLETMDAVAQELPELAWVLVTHHLEELPTSTTHAVLISDGRVTRSGPADEAISTASISEAFAHPITVTRTDGRWSARAGRTGVLDLPHA